MRRPRLLAVALILAVPEALAHGQDREVVEAALEHFGARSDAYFYDPKGLLLIWPETAKWTSGFGGLEDPQGECPADRALLEVLRTRNSLTRPASDLVEPSTRWRLVKEEEKATMSPGLPLPPNAPKRPPTKTVVTLHQPALSPAEDVALVVFRFAWSMHGAVARYALHRAGSRWKVTCSKLIFYP